MNLLLDARRKSQQANGHATSADELRLEDHAPSTRREPDDTEHTAKADEAARSAGSRLFSAKSLSPEPGSSRLNPKLLLALGGTVLLLGIGGGYLWYLDSSSANAPLRPLAAPPAPPAIQAQPAARAEPAPQSTLVPGIGAPAAGQAAPATSPGAASGSVAAPYRPARASERLPQSPEPIKIEQRKMAEQVDPQLLDAYSAYRAGKPDEAQQLYLALFKKDARDPDVLLGLATLAQQRGENQAAAQYFARMLELDPRNAAANAGMAALTTDDGNNESRLKNLLREQGNSAALHFALGNLYAGQSRWGEAQQAYFNAYTLESDNAEYAFNLAVSLDHLGQAKLAAQHYQRAMQLDPSHIAGFDHAQISQRVQDLTR